MRVKDLVSLLSADTFYKVYKTDNPHYLWWWGRGNNVQSLIQEISNKKIKSIQWTSKGLKIYI